jgi:outer membrane receptor protein involved in Fe transport
VNGARGHARGIEIAYQQYFDMLPGWLSGFGVQANYTYVDSKRSCTTRCTRPTARAATAAPAT